MCNCAYGCDNDNNNGNSNDDMSNIRLEFNIWMYEYILVLESSCLLLE